MKSARKSVAGSGAAADAAARIAPIVRASKETAALLEALHGLWEWLCRERLVRRTAGLVELSGHFERLASGVPAYDAAVAKLTSGLALLCARHYGEADQRFSQVKTATGGQKILAVAALCWRAIALALMRDYQRARKSSGAAERMLRPISDAPAALAGLANMTRALIEYKMGESQAALESLNRVGTAFYSPAGPSARNLPCFQAEALLIRAKVLREMGLYSQALECARDSQLLRRSHDDFLGEAWCCLECARLHRFEADYDKALAQLDSADRLLRGTDYTDWLARVADQRGDVFRKRGDLVTAERQYRRAAQLARDSTDRELKGHLTNSLIRLLEEKGEREKALELLKQGHAIWRGSKGYGKCLYLWGSIEAGLQNYQRAGDLFREAIVQLKRFEMRSYEALAHDALARLFLTQGRKDEACREWSEALRLAGKVEAKEVIARIHDHVRRLDALDLVPMVAASVSRSLELSAQLDLSRAREARADTRRQIERRLTGHWFVGELWREALAGRKPPACLGDVCAVLDSHDWHALNLAIAPAPPEEAVDVGALARECCARAAARLRRELQLTVPARPFRFSVNRRYLGEALTAFFRAAHTAFGTTRFRLMIHPRQSGGFRGVEFRLEKPRPAGFGQAMNLVPLNTAREDKELARFFDHGYTGNFTLMDFLVGLALWGNVEFTARSVVIKLPYPEKQGG